MSADRMQTHCPHCGTVFRIGPEQLEAADGRVRCGQCRQAFNARDQLRNEPRQPRDSGLTEPIADAVAGVLWSDIGADRPVRERPSRRAFAAWTSINVLLLAVLCGQLLFVQRAAFAQDASLRPLLARMCDIAGCTLPPRRALDRIELIRRNVYTHPNREDALLIEATLVNSAAFAQPYPILTIGLGDRRGRTLARRNFAPDEYVDDLPPDARMVPGRPVHITLEVRAPEHTAHTFEFAFSPAAYAADNAVTSS